MRARRRLALTLAATTLAATGAAAAVLVDDPAPAPAAEATFFDAVVDHAADVANADAELIAAAASDVALLEEIVDDAASTMAAEEAAEVAELAAAEQRAATWNRLADCESGDWMDGQPLPDTRRWDYGLTFSHGDIFEGGLNFHPGTWDAFKDADMPGHAGNATREQQIVVGERVLAEQGWKAWPVCSRKLGLR